MGKLIYSTNASLDGYIAEPGKSDWAMPDEEVHAFEEVSSEADIAIGGAELAGQAIGAGLVDEFHLRLFPIVVGGGKRALLDDVRAQLELLDERRFGNGGVALHDRLSV